MKRIAVIEDETLIRTLLGAVLRKRGFQVVEILPTDPFEVLDALVDCAPDLVLLDVVMPGCPGFEVLAGIRADSVLESCPVILVTGLEDPDQLAALEELGIQGRLSKPFKPDSLERDLTTLLG